MVLTIHLKRFTVTGRKINEPIAYPETLNLGPYMSDVSPVRLFFLKYPTANLVFPYSFAFPFLSRLAALPRSFLPPLRHR